MEIVHAGDRLAGESDDHVARDHVGAVGWTSLLHRQDQETALLLRRVLPREGAGKRHVLPRDADVAAPDAPEAHELERHGPRGIDPHREAESLRHRNYRSVDAHYFAAGIDQRPTRVAGVQ